MTDITNNPIFTDEDAARAHLERLRWPDGVLCVHCGAFGDAISKVEKTDKRRKPASPEKRHRPARDGRYYCKECEGTFTVTVGTVLEDSHVPIHKWMLAFRLMMSSKKGFSAHQMHRTLGVSYKTAWYMGHRMREAVRSGFLAPPMGGSSSKTVEADETFIGRKRGMPKQRGAGHKHAVLTLVDRSTGEARSFHVDTAGAKEILPIVRANIAKETTIATDEANTYTQLDWEKYNHQTVNHEKEEWARGDVHTNTVEGYFSIFKRGMKGVYQHSRASA